MKKRKPIMPLLTNEQVSGRFIYRSFPSKKAKQLKSVSSLPSLAPPNLQLQIVTNEMLFTLSDCYKNWHAH